MTPQVPSTPRRLPAMPAPQPAKPDARGPAPRSDVFCTLACLGKPQGAAFSLAG
ncbi:MAG: hypothetical protein ACT6S0_19525 [Roseateles sp.]|uniref:hypothetical protein n=1 Tax=Roseateles sp. TaxID=1971397 RepID=UPI0040374441